MKNNATRTIRSEEITIDVRICAALAANRGGEVYLAAIAPDMELTVITLDEAPDILPCFEEDERRIKLNNRIEILERRIQEEDSAEVNEMVRTAKVTPEQLAALLRQSATATPTPAALSAVGATFEKEVDTDED